MNSLPTHVFTCFRPVRPFATSCPRHRPLAHLRPTVPCCCWWWRCWWWWFYDTPGTTTSAPKRSFFAGSSPQVLTVLCGSGVHSRALLTQNWSKLYLSNGVHRGLFLGWLHQYDTLQPRVPVHSWNVVWFFLVGAGPYFLVVAPLGTQDVDPGGHFPALRTHKTRCSW